MKKLLIISLVIILLAAGCSGLTSPRNSIETIFDDIEATLAAMPTQTALPTSQPSAQPTTRPTAQPTVQPTPTITLQPVENQPTPTVIEITTNASVGIDNLKLRVGPGFGYPSSRLLTKGQQLDVIGRSNDSRWLTVLLPDGSGGWLFASYVLMDLNIASLPVKEAAGGPNPLPTQQPVYTIYITINGLQAEVSVDLFPANTDIVARLGLPGKSADLYLGSGRTDASGKAVLNFSMPAKWQDGTPLTGNELVMVVSTSDGAFNTSADVLYIH
jgi:hypothetical protein